ncbi:MAG: hypothetical protein AAFQ04_01440, partial [Pseudomonadota bacterium]
MSTQMDLNTLVQEGGVSTQPQRGEILLSVDPNKKSVAGVRILSENKPTLMKRVFKRDVGRMIVVRAGRSALMQPIELRTEDVATEIAFTVSLKLDIQTPQAQDEDALRQLGHAFRDASLEPYGGGAPDELTDSPSGRLRAELLQWLKTRYRSGSALEDHDTRAWKERENKEIAHHIRKEYGLDAQAKLRIVQPPPIILGPVTAKVKTTAVDSDKELHFNVKLGCRLKGDNVFAAPTLTASDLEALITRQTDLYLRQQVKLQDFRFSKDWLDGLKKALETELNGYDREITEYYVPISSNELYSRGPHAIEAGDAVFQPSGWQGDDHISFSANAMVTVVDAAAYEARRDHSKLTRTEEQLREWLQSALQAAVGEELHRIHDQNIGYAALLANWEGPDGYRVAIQENLGRRAKAEGLEASAIIAKPDREEMDLLKGAEIVLEERSYDCLEPGGQLDFEASVQIKIESFNDIKDLLNRTHTPMVSLRDDVILEILTRAVRKIPYLHFYQFFQSGPWPEQGGEPVDDSGCVGWLRSEFSRELKAHKIELVGFSARQSSTEYYDVFDSLQKHVPERVTFQVSRRALKTEAGHSADAVFDAYDIGFDLGITGLNGKNIQPFFRDWSTFRSQNSNYGAVRDLVEEKLPAKFTVEDRIILAGTEKHGVKYRDACQKLVIKRLSEFLAETFGLAGAAIAIDVENKGEAVIAIAQSDADQKDRLDAIKSQRKVAKQIRSINKKQKIAAHIAQTNAMVENIEID